MSFVPRARPQRMNRRTVPLASCPLGAAVEEVSGAALLSLQKSCYCYGAGGAI
jgi:hypothetical protein